VSQQLTGTKGKAVLRGEGVSVLVALQRKPVILSNIRLNGYKQFRLFNNSHEIKAMFMKN